jgi:hypothetical protein
MDDVRKQINWLLHKHEGGLGMSLTIEQVNMFKQTFKEIDEIVTSYMEGAMNAQEAINEVTLAIDKFYNREKKGEQT